MDRPTTRFDKHSGKLLAAFWIFLVVAGLAALEWSLAPKSGRYVASRAVSGPGPERRLMLREWEPNTDYSFSPPPERRLYAGADVRETYALSTDAQGFIEPAVRHEKPDLNIVFMGGSTTECLYVAPENRFPYLAAKNLETALGLKINGINAARAGNNSLHSLLLLAGKVLPLRPDYIVLMEATNDIGSLTYGTYWQQMGSKRIIDNQKISVDQAIRILSTALIPYTSDLVSGLRRRLKGEQQRPEGRDDGPAGPERSRQDMGRDFTDALTSFVHLTRAWGSKPVLMTQVHVQPSSSAEQQSSFLSREQVGGTLVNPATFASDQDYFNAIIRDVAQREKVVLIDLARVNDWKFGDVYDSIHFTDQGSKKVAEIVAAALQDEIASAGSHAGLGTPAPR